MSLRAGTITRRRVDCDISVMDIEGTEVKGYFQNCSYTLSREVADVSAAQDTWVQREFCRNDLEFTLGKIMYEDEDLSTIFLNEDTVYVCCDIAGKTLYFVGIMENANATSGNPMTEGATIRNASGTPTLV